MGNPIAWLRDDFQDSAQAPAWALAAVTGSATKSEASGQAQFALPSSTAGSHHAYYRSAAVYDFTGDGCFISIAQMVAVGVAATAYFLVSLDSANYLQWVQTSNTLKAQTIVAGVTTDLFSATWSATNHKYLRIRESGGSILFDSSTNGTSWTNRATVANPFDVSSLSVQFGATCGNVGSPGTFKIEEFNTILPSLTTNWRWTQVEWPELWRFRSITCAATSGQGYMATSNDGASWRYFAGPLGSASGGYNALVEYGTQAAAQAMAVNLPADGRWDLPALVECRFLRLYHRSTTGSSYTLREYYPRRLVQSDDVEAESIKATNIAAASVTADKMNVIQLSAITANIGGLVIDTSGYLWQGSGTPDSPTTGLKIFNSGGVGKLSTYNGGVEQVTLDTDGKFKAGVGAVVLDASGASIDTATAQTYNAAKAISFKNFSTGDLTASMYAWNSVTVNGIDVRAYNAASHPGRVVLLGQAVSGADSWVDIDGGLFAHAIGLNADAVNLSGGLNVGSAMGASTGEIRASDRLRLSSATGMALEMREITLANNAIALVMPAVGNQLGWIIISDDTGDNAIYSITGGVHVAQEVADPGGGYSPTAGTASSTNIYWSAGNNRYEIENKRGGTVNYKVWIMRWG